MPGSTEAESIGIGWRLRTAACLAVLPPVLLLHCLGALSFAALRAPQRTIDGFYRGFARFAVWFAGTRLEVRGLEHVDRDQAYVIVPNHESAWDPVVLVAAFPTSVRFLIKRELLKIPVFGATLRNTGNIKVERTNTQADVERIRERMSSRPVEVSVLVYAEGTRSRDGALHDFKKGAFATAITYGLPVLPVGHAGCRRIWPPERLQVRGGPVCVEVGRPIPVDGLRHEDREKLRRETYEAVRELRTRARRRLRDLGVEPGGID